MDLFGQRQRHRQRPRYHDKILQIFQRLHSRTEYAGTGLGLSLVKRTSNGHGSKVWLGPGRRLHLLFFNTGESREYRLVRCLGGMT